MRYGNFIITYFQAYCNYYYHIKLFHYCINATPFVSEGRIWDLTVSVPDHYLRFYFNIRVASLSSSVARRSL